MDSHLVRDLEEAVGVAIARVLETKRIKPPPTAREVHLMAKAAVTVLEGVMEGRGKRDVAS